MPLSELYRMAKGKFESSQKKSSYSEDPSFRPDGDFFELVWGNGQFLVQDSSSKARKSPNNDNSPAHAVPSHSPNSKDFRNVTNSRMENFGSIDTILNDFHLSEPSGKIGLNQDDEMVDWLNHPIDEHMQHEYCPGFMPDLSGADASEFPADNNAVLSEKLKQVTEFKTSGGNGEANRPRSSQLYPLLSHHSPTLTPSSSSISLDTSSFNASNTVQNAFSGDLSPVSASYIDFPSMKTGRKDPGFSNKGSTFTNFPHFSRPAALVKANLQRIGARQLTMERRQSNDKVSAATSGTPSISTSICSGNGLGKNMVSQEKLILVKVNVDSKVLMETQVDDPLPTGQSGAICHETTFKNSKSYRKIIVEGTSDGEKTKEPIVATSSICSANCVERVLNDATHNLKRKCCDAEDSGYPSEDIEEEMVGAKISVPAQCGTSSKRSRAAEVHNLSERKRRDRINEKMRALQELIPNCNKVDKASMLDEAIEYLKMLQLQVQIMSMQTGMYMPPVMLPAGMQHMSAAHMVQYSHMSQGVGMGMGMNYGAGVVDVNGGSPGFPIMQVPPMQGAHYPKIPVLGIPGQGSSMSIPCAPLMHLSGPTTKSSSPLNASGPAGPFKFLDSAQLSTSEDPMHNPNSQMFRDNIMNESANQPQSTNSVIQHANALTHTGDRTPENVTSGNGSINFPNKNETNS